MAVKSKLSRLLTAGNFASLIRRFDSPSFPVDHLQLRQAQQVAGIIDRVGGALTGHLVVLTQKGR